MTLYLIGLGIYREPLITRKWFDIIMGSKHIFFERYTSPTPYDIQYLRKFFGRRDIQHIDRETLENRTDEIVEMAFEDDVSILVYGDPLIATTHRTLILTTVDKGVEYQVLHNVSSYIYAVTESGLDIYKVGPIGTLIRGGQDINKSTLEKIGYNLRHGFHSPILLEYNAEEGYIMHPSDALDIIKKDKDLWRIITDNNSYIIVLMALGFDEEYKKAYKPSEIRMINELPSGYPAIIIITGRLHFMEREYIEKVLRSNI